MNKTIGDLQGKITRLVSENSGMSGQMGQAQEALRLSSNQNQKIMIELTDYKQRIDQNNQENSTLKNKIQKLMSENSSLSGEVGNAQEALRLSSATQAKLQRELQDLRGHIDSNNQDSETYRIKIQKLVSENTVLGDQVRGAQENIRLSAGTINKLTNELKITCNENEDLKRKLQETTNVNRKIPEYENKIAILSQ